jgi:hypothetical protein
MRVAKKFPALRAAAVLALMLPLAGCGPSFFSGASSMRIEVELYKGPLSKSLPVQEGELVGIIRETAAAMKIWKAGAEKISECREGKYVVSKQARMGIDDAANATQVVLDANKSVRGAKVAFEAQAKVASGQKTPALKLQAEKDLDKANENARAAEKSLDNAIKRASKFLWPDVTDADCGYLQIAKDGAKFLIDEINLIVTVKSDAKTAHLYRFDSRGPLGKLDLKSTKNRLGLYNITKNAAAVAKELNTRGFLIAFSQIKHAPMNDDIRATVADFTTVAAEFSNQITTRTDVIFKQIAQGQKASKMAMGDYLRDAETTSFLDLYDWYRATHDGGSWDEAPIYGGDVTGLSRTDKVRVGETLFADHYWSKVNQVHANGQGDVGMAFIKDDIGNWNLKSFSNNPAELLKAYTGVGKAIIGAVTELAKGAATGGVSALVADGGKSLGGMEKLLGLGRKIAFGGPGGSGAGGNQKLIDTLRAAAIQRLQKLRLDSDPQIAGFIRFSKPPEVKSTITIEKVPFQFVETGTGATEVVIGTLAVTLGNFVTKLTDSTDANIKKWKFTHDSKDTLIVKYPKELASDKKTKFTAVAVSSSNASVTDNLLQGDAVSVTELNADTKKILHDYATQVETLQLATVPAK